MTFDPRDQIWEAIFETYYNSYYEELLADELINRWQLADEVTKVLVALTASGSAVSGWALWSEAEFKVVWAFLAGIGAVLAIVHTALGVPSRLKDWSDIKQWFATLRIDLETFRYRMQVDPQFPIKEFADELVELRKRYGQGIQRLKNDILMTRHLRDRVQDQLNERLGTKVIQQ